MKGIQEEVMTSYLLNERFMKQGAQKVMTSYIPVELKVQKKTSCIPVE